MTPLMPDSALIRLIWLVLLAVPAAYSHAAAAAAAEPPAEFWELLSGPASAEAFTTVYRDDQPDRDLPREDFSRLLEVAHQPVGAGRQLFRLRFQKPINLDHQSVLLYIDSDHDAATGREDGANAGADHQVGSAALGGASERVDYRYENDGFRRNGDMVWQGMIGSDVYVLLETPVHQADGASRFRLGWLTQQKTAGGQVLVDEKAGPLDVSSAPASSAHADLPAAMPAEFLQPADRYTMDSTRLYPAVDGDGLSLIARLNWLGPVRVEYGSTLDLGEHTGWSLANRLHQVAVPAQTPDGDEVRFARLTALTPTWDVQSSAVLELEPLKPVTPPASSAERRSTVTSSLAIPVMVSNPTGKPLKAYPHRLGVPFATGQRNGLDDLRLRDAEGEEIPADFTMLSAWPDGSVRWAAVTFLADIPAAGEATFEVTAEAGARAATSSLDLQQDESGLTVDTGALRFVITREPFAVLQDVAVRGKNLGDLDLRGVAVGVDGQRFSTAGGLESLHVERQGAASAVIVAKGRHVAEDQPGHLLAWEMRLRVWAGSPLLEIEHVFGTDDVTRELNSFGSLTLHMQAPGGADELDVFQWMDDRLEVTRDARTESRTGQWNEPVPLGGGVSVAVRDLWQNYPKRVKVGDGRVEIGLAPKLADEQYDAYESLTNRLFLSMRDGRYSFVVGVQRRHTMMFDFGGGSAPAVDTLARTTPQVYAATGAAGPILTEEQLPQRFAGYPDHARAGLERYVQSREDYRAFGMMNYGDWFGERRHNWGNNEYDTTLGLLGHFTMLGDPAFLREGSLMAEHVVDIDTRHHSPDPREVGSVYIHLVGHTGGYFGDDWRRMQQTELAGAFTAVDIQNWGHYWGEGPALHFWLRGDPRSREALLNTTNRIATTYLNGPVETWRNPRQQGWILKVPIAAYKVSGDPFHLLVARTLVDHILDRQDESGGWSVLLFNASASPQQQSYGSTNFPIGILLSSLARYHEVTGDERVADAIVAGTRWLIEDLWEDEPPIGFRYSSGPYARGGNRFFHITYPLTYAHKLTADRTFHDVALEYSDRYLTDEIGPTHEFGKIWSQHLREIPYTLPLLKQLMHTPHAGLVHADPSGQPIRWVVIPAADGQANVRVLARGEGSYAATLALQTLDGETLDQWEITGQGSTDRSIPLPDAPTGRLLALTLTLASGEAAWDVALLRGKQMLELRPGQVIGEGVPYTRFRFEVPPGVDHFDVEVEPAGNGSRLVQVLDPNGEVIERLDAPPGCKTSSRVAVPALWPTLAGASYRGPFNDSDLQYSIVSDGPVRLKLDGVPAFVTPSAVAFFRTSIPHVTVAGDTALDLGDGPLDLDASASGSLDGEPLTFTWDLGDSTTATGPRVHGHLYREPGDYTVTLRVEKAGARPVVQTVAVNAAPAALLTGDASNRVFINAPDYTAHTGPDLVKDERINSIGQIITYWSGDPMNVLTWPFEVDRPGRYRLITKFANNTEGGSARRYWVDDQQPDPAMKNVAFPYTGGWSRFSDDWQWQTLTDDAGQPIVFDLTAGRHELKVGNTDGGLAVDYFVFQRIDH